MNQRNYNKRSSIGKHPLKSGIATFMSFFLIGFIPLLSFVLANSIPDLNRIQFTLAVVLTGVALLIVGGVKGELVNKHPIRSSLETLVIGGIAAVLAFAVGYFLRGLV